MPLMFLNADETARVIGIGGSDDIKRHLGSLGFSPGALVRVIDDAGGGKIVGINDTRLALNGDLARRIQVEPVKQKDHTEKKQ